MTTVKIAAAGLAFGIGASLHLMSGGITAIYSAAQIGVHTHPADENVTILSGTLHFAAGDKFDTKTAKPFGPGSYFSIGKGKPMFAYTTDKEVVLQLHGSGPWGLTYLDPADGSAKKK